MYTSPLGATAGYMPSASIRSITGILSGADHVTPPSSEFAATPAGGKRVMSVQPMWRRPKKGLVGVLSTARSALSSPGPWWIGPTYAKVWQSVVDLQSEIPALLSAA